jgi:hypothetical protein
MFFLCSLITLRRPALRKYGPLHRPLHNVMQISYCHENCSTTSYTLDVVGYRRAHELARNDRYQRCMQTLLNDLSFIFRSDQKSRRLRRVFPIKATDRTKADAALVRNGCTGSFLNNVFLHTQLLLCITVYKHAHLHKPVSQTGVSDVCEESRKGENGKPVAAPSLRKCYR